jgi:glycosyltransferase involved in cell wall biosynthesis
VTLRRPDVVHLTTSGQLAVVRDVAISWTARALRIPLAYHIRFGRVPDAAARRTREWRWLRRAMELARVVISIDEATQAAIRMHAPSVRVECVPNCIDAAAVPPQRATHAGMRTMLYLGWVIPTKGIDDLVDAWSRLNPPGWRLLVVGPAESAYLEKLSARIGPAVVQFTGELSHEEAMAAMAQSDGFVLPSHTEGFPNVVLEAMALAKPIIATSVGAIPEMLADDCGILVPPRDLAALADALGRVTSDRDVCAPMAVRAHRRAVAEYSIEAVFARYCAIWSTLPTGDGIAPEVHTG